MEVTLIIKKNTGTNRVIETPVESYTNRDNAVIKCAQLNQSEVSKDTTYHLCEIQHNESETVEAYSDNSKVYVQDEDGNEIELSYETENGTHEHQFHESVAPDESYYISIKSISIHGTDLNHLGLSERLKRDIIHECDNAAEYLTEQIEP